MRRPLSWICTGLILLVVGVVSLRRPGPGAAAPSVTIPPAKSTTRTRGERPEAGADQAVRGLLAAARAGEVGVYLDAFAGPLRDRLERDRATRGDAAVAGELRTAAAARRGHAVYAAEPDGPDAATVVVESVYASHNERQTYRLERRDEAWKVVSVLATRALRPDRATGSPATFEAPEGIPVPTGKTSGR
jgi:hypothetical protein